MKPASPSAIPAIPRHQEVDTLIRQHSQRLVVGLFDLLELIQEVIDGKYYEYHGFQDPAPYLEDRTGLKYTTVTRYLAILEALRALPPPDVPAARQILAALGTHRAHILAPALKKEPADWREWAALARQGSEEALQEAVSSCLGLKARGKGGAPGDKLWGFILNQIPPERRPQAEWVVKTVMEIGETQNGIAVLLYMIDVMERDLAAQGIYREGKA